MAFQPKDSQADRAGKRQSGMLMQIFQGLTGTRLAIAQLSAPTAANQLEK